MPAPERREYILEKAAEVFSKKGYRMASVSDIVEEAGIGRGTFYVYFDSKKEIFLELIEAYFEGFATQLKENHLYLEEAFRSGNIIRTWRDNLMRILQFHMENSNLTVIAYKEALGSDADFSDKVAQLSSMAREILGVEFQMMYERGMMRKSDIAVVTTMIMGSLINVIMEHMLYESGRDLGSLVDTFVEYHIRALIPMEGDISRATKSALMGLRADDGKP